LPDAFVTASYPPVSHPGHPVGADIDATHWRRHEPVSKKPTADEIPVNARKSRRLVKSGQTSTLLHMGNII
jgi:hypothetical protein